VNSDTQNTTPNQSTNIITTNGQPGDPCASNEDCAVGVCRAGVCDEATCRDGIQNGEETDVDCGALGCALCDIGKMCSRDSHCVSGICNDGTCVDKNCTDGVQNGLETDVDCGFLCDACADGRGCLEDTDCVSQVCDSGTCAVPTCEDQRANGVETDVDCGGPDCEPCPDTLACSAPSDCQSGVCTNGACAVPTCTDGVQNGQETALDCGGPSCNPCPVGQTCESGDDCESSVCNESGRCAAPTCIDGETNGTETDRDCGGQQSPSCPRCTSGRFCNVGSDCDSGVCDQFGQCAQPTCEDGVRNGTETATDCGGRCEPCGNGQACNEGRDCLSFVCQGGTCQPSGCTDGTQNGSETDNDCGGPTCPGCVSGRSCLQNSDCQSNLCEIQQGQLVGRCARSACDDGVRNGLESDVDCGGPDCPACTAGDSCNAPGDCASFVCQGSSNPSCQPATCSDGVKNADETDVDCGGSTCRECGLGDGCMMDEDCTTGICDGGPNGPFCAVCTENDTRLTQQTCGYGNRGRTQQRCTDGIWVNDTCEGVYYRSCREILAAGVSTGDGTYEIDPDGDAQLYNSINVFCDMSTAGGGWTEITQCMAQNDLFGDLIAIDTASRASISSCAPVTRDEADGHTYYYEFTWPGGFSEFYLDGYEVKGNADPQRGDTSDFGHIMTNWNTGYSNFQGDVAFGTPTRIVSSYSRQGLSNNCNSCTYPWPAGNTRYAVPSSTKFRIGWGETGPQYEGWYPWWNGTIRLR
jgi:hypothetical protein